MRNRNSTVVAQGAPARTQRNSDTTKGGIPKPPKIAQSYASGVKTYLDYLPKIQGAEQGSRQLYDPQRISEQQGLQEYFGPNQYRQMLNGFKQLDPTQFAAREQLGHQVSADAALGGHLSDQERMATQQNVRGAQEARGNIYGGAAIDAEVTALDNAGGARYQQRLGNLASFTQQPSMAALTAQVQPVAADRTSAYVDPNAGYKGVDAANQLYGNRVGAAQAGKKTGGWSTQDTVNTAATVGKIAIDAYGAYGSDRRIKKNIEKVGQVPHGAGIYEFEFKKHHGPPGRHQGAIAQNAEKTMPHAVHTDRRTGLKAVDYAKVGFPMKRVG